MPTLNVPKSSTSSVGRTSASSTAAWPAWRRERTPGSVGLRFEPDIERLRQLHRGRAEQPPAGPLVLVGDRETQEVGEALANVADRGLPGDGDRAAVQPVAVVRGRVDAELAVGLR